MRTKITMILFVSSQPLSIVDYLKKQRQRKMKKQILNITIICMSIGAVSFIPINPNDPPMDYEPTNCEEISQNAGQALYFLLISQGYDEQVASARARIEVTRAYEECVNGPTPEPTPEPDA